MIADVSERQRVQRDVLSIHFRKDIEPRRKILFYFLFLILFIYLADSFFYNEDSKLVHN